MDSEQAIFGSQREWKDTQGERRIGSAEHKRNTSSSNSLDTNDSNSDDVSEDEMKLPGNL